MSKSSAQNVEFQNQNLLVKRHVDKAALKRRGAVALLLVYYIWILVSAWSMSKSWWWSLEEGLMWLSGGQGRFFPIPIQPGRQIFIPLDITHGYLVDQVFYLVFMHGGIWIAWIALGLLYLFLPYQIDIRLLLDRIRTRLHDRSQNETR